MTGNPREGFQAKQEDDKNINIDNKFTKAISTSRQWSAFRNPRIFRVSRSFGGKDRHSKVYTVRGLRDRRIRLSVPTAIQLYDLQDKLNLSQPSKVIDWLLEATKLDIDKLPPLQMPQGVAQFYQQTLLPHHHHHLVHESSGNFSHEPSLGANFYGANSTFFKEPRYWDRDNTLSRLKEKQEDERVGSIEKGKWVLKTNDQENEDGNHGIGDNYNSSSQVSAGQKLFPIIGTTTHTSLLSGMLNGNAIPYNSSYHISEPNSNLSLMSHFGSHGLLTSQVDNSHQIGGSGVQFPSGYSQFLFCPPYSAATPSLFGPYSNITASSAESEPSRSSQFNHIQFLSSTSHPHHIPIIPSTFSFKRLDSDHNNERTQSDHKSGTDRS